MVKVKSQNYTHIRTHSHSGAVIHARHATRGGTLTVATPRSLIVFSDINTYKSISPSPAYNYQTANA